MNQLLQIKQKFSVSSADDCIVEKFLGSGGQGEVYQVTMQGKPYALKWYFPKMATADQKESLEKLINIGAPNDKFLWPQFILTNPDNNTFGYIMPLRLPRFKGINDLVKRKIEPSFKTLAKAGVYLADSFLKLHAKGLCYRDISFGNVFFDAQTGDIQICDNDNVTTNGNPKFTVLGTPRFTAPEIVRSEAIPSTNTDLFSLGVLLHYMLFVHHPLEGEQESQIKCFDLPAMTKLYGTNPVYIFDPDNKTNRPVRGYHDNAIEYWNVYPDFLKQLFIRAFTNGLQPNKRIYEIEWRDNMLRLHDSVMYCRCGAENFYDAGKNTNCWACKAAISIAPRLKTLRHNVVLNADTVLYPFHIDGMSSCEFTNQVAQVNQHPQNKNLWGLKNLSNETWTITSTDGLMKDVLPNQNVALINGIKINFGKTIGEIMI